MMINKFISYFFCLLFSYISIGVAENRLIAKGYFDYDSYEDLLECREITSDSISYSCKFLLKGKTISIFIDGYNIGGQLFFSNTQNKGEVKVESANGIFSDEYYYQYNREFENWFLKKYVFRYNASGPDDDRSDIVFDNITEQWSIDQKIILIKDKNTLLSLEEVIKSKYREKDEETNKIQVPVPKNKNKYFQALMNGIEIDSLNIEKNNIVNYNNIAYYLEKSGVYKESIIILEQVIQYAPSRTVAYLNLGDAYWGDKQFQFAKNNYQIYVDLMKKYNKENIVPDYVNVRLQ